ncbi:metal-binding, possibly nucleic acid-binding protein [Legionella israelensis]|nr:metal-binding protein [Legionella israelensis]SCX91796.1 uncharacterized protein SAMN02746069_00659 [Legionella israelensis DSM 19235]STX58048.1 metal-binding, possibly nucleic acid-binding protein [Legionella israelensis]
MRLNLKELVDKPEKLTTTIEIKDRLPVHITQSCSVQVTYHVEMIDDIYLVHLNTEAGLNICCLRCMREVVIPYKNSTSIAVCQNDVKAEQMLMNYECIVSPSAIIDLTEIVTDELHLYSSQYHLNSGECNVDFG